MNTTKNRNKKFLAKKRSRDGYSLKAHTRKLLLLSSVFTYLALALIFAAWEYRNQKSIFSERINNEVSNIDRILKDKITREELLINQFIKANKNQSKNEIKNNFMFFLKKQTENNTYYITDYNKIIQITPPDYRNFYGLDFSNIIGKAPFVPKVYQSFLTHRSVLIRTFKINEKYYLIQEKDLNNFSSSVGFLQSGIKGSYAVLIDKTGRLIYHPDHELIKIRYNFFFDIEHAPEFHSSALQVINLKGRKYYLKMRELYNKSNLYLVYLVPGEIIYSAILFSLISNLIIAVIVTGVIFIVIHFVMNRYIMMQITSIVNSITSYNMLGKELPSYENIAGRFIEFNRLISAVNYTIKKNNDQSRYLEKSTQKLIKVQDYLYHVFNALPVIIFIIDKEGNILNHNASAREILKDSFGKVYSKNIETIFPELSDILQIVKDSKAEIDDLTIPSKKIMIQELPQFFNIHLFSFYTEQYDDYLLQMENITERIQLDEMAMHAEKMKTLGSITSGIAHELNNPLGIINQNTENAIRRLSSEIPKNRQIAARYGIDLDKLSDYINERGITGYFEEIRSASHRAGRIIRNMLNFSRTPRGEFELCNPDDIIEETIRLLLMDSEMKKKYFIQNINIDLRRNNEAANIDCIRLELQQVLLNIIKNAIQAIEDKPVEEKNIQIETSLDKMYYNIAIRDNGSGIDENVINKIFNPFFSTKEVGHGTGLGLSVSYYIITNHHKGKLTAANHESGGAEFRILLPLKRKNEKQKGSNNR